MRKDIYVEISTWNKFLYNIISLPNRNFGKRCEYFEKTGAT